MNQFNRNILFGLILSLLLSACGIKGPLYIPEDPSKRYPHNRRASLSTVVVAQVATQFLQHPIYQA